MVINKKIIIGVSIIVTLVFIALVGWFVFQKEEPLPEEVKNAEEEKTIEQFLEELTPKESKSPTPEEQEELDRLLEEMTPIPSEPTPEEQKEIEELLKQLTP